MENERKEYNHTYKKIAIILYIVAIIMIIVGISMIIFDATDNGIVNFYDNFNNINSGINEIVFERTTSKNMSFAIVLVSVGGILFFIATILIFVDLAKGKTFGLIGKNLIDKVINTASYMNTTFQDKMSESKNKKIIYCKYCGTALDETEKKCPNCGASKLSKN